MLPRRVLDFVLSAAVSLGLMLPLSPGAGANEQAGDVAAEERYPRGLIDTPPQELEGLEWEVPRRAFLPASVDLSARFPTPGKQRYQDCVSWATGYAARSYYNAALQVDGVIQPENIASPAYIHNLATEGAECRTDGTFIPRALGILQKVGSASLASMPLDHVCRATNAPEPDRERFGIKSFQVLAQVLLNAQKQPVGGQPVNLDVVKQALAAGHPVPFGMQVGKRFMRLKRGQIYRGSVLSTPDEDVGGHAMAVVGYDDSKSAFRIINSWGTGWADGGFGWIDYGTFQSDIKSAFRIVPFVDPPRPSPRHPVSPEIIPSIGKDLACSGLDLSRDQDGRTTVSGFVATEEDLRQVTQEASEIGARVQVAIRPWPACEALLTLRNALRASDRPILKTLDGRETLRIGDELGFEVKTPDFPSYVYLVYLQADGTVVNLLPRNNVLRAQTPPNTVLRFGDGTRGRPRFRISPPAGDEVLIVLATRSPLAELEALENDGNRFFRVAASARGLAGPADRLFLSALRIGLSAQPLGNQPVRETSAAVLHLKIEDMPQ